MFYKISPVIAAVASIVITQGINVYNNSQDVRKAMINDFVAQTEEKVENSEGLLSMTDVAPYIEVGTDMCQKEFEVKEAGVEFCAEELEEMSDTIDLIFRGRMSVKRMGF